MELANCTATLLNEINGLRLTQRQVALTYALAMRSSEPTNWRQVNLAIISRWSRSGLERVKRMAHKIAGGGK